MSSRRCWRVYLFNGWEGNITGDSHLARDQWVFSSFSALLSTPVRLPLQFPATEAELSALFSLRDEGSWQLLGCCNGVYNVDIQLIPCNPRKQIDVKPLLVELDAVACQDRSRASSGECGEEVDRLRHDMWPMWHPTAPAVADSLRTHTLHYLPNNNWILVLSIWSSFIGCSGIAKITISCRREV